METLKFVIVGHVDHGKSTLIGRLLYDTNALSPEKIEEIRKTSADLGRETEFAYLLDHLEEERQQGITIDTTQVFFSTDKRRYVIIDAPGHVEFVKNMITGASQAEAAFLIVDVQQGVQEQTKRHAYILSLLGIKQVIVIINKLDLVDNDQKVFDAIQKQVRGFLNTLNIEALHYVPISAINGDNVAKRSDDIGWYDGPTVLESLDTLVSGVTQLDESFVFPVQDVYKIQDKRIIVGKIESGMVDAGQEVKILPRGTLTKIQSIERFNETSHQAFAGESIGLTTVDPAFVDRSNIICERETGVMLTDEISGNIFWMSKQAFKKEERLTLRLATQEVICTVEKIVRRINSSSLEVLEEDAQCLENLEVGEVIMKTKRPIVIKKFSELQGLGRFVLVRGDHICAGGIIV